MSVDLGRVSKRLSHALRHDPGKYGLTLDAAGYAPVQGVLDALAVTADQLDLIVAGTDKQRFAYDESGTLIRALHGHSILVNLGLPPTSPPDLLFHGTTVQALPQIRTAGLLPMARNHVHLSASPEAASMIGARRGVPAVLEVDALRMFNNGRSFYLVAENGVWLTGTVPPGYLTGGHRTPLHGPGCAKSVPDSYLPV